MTKSILVPLDGSTLAEAAMAPARFFAEAWEASVTLIHIIEQGAPQEVHHERHLTRPGEAEAYLQQVAGRAFPPDIKVQIHVHTAPVADVPRSIVEHADEFRTDLIVMCTHGGSTMGRLIYGSVAQQVVAQGNTPLLLIKPDGEAGAFKLDSVLVPLDPTSAHDDSLTFAQELARTFSAELLLVSVTPSPSTLPGSQAAAGTFMPATAHAFLDIHEENTRAHLQGHVDALRAEGLEVTAGVLRGDPAAAISSAADDLRVDLIIFTTHRRAGLGAFWARSVAPSVAQRTRIPILLIPLAEPGGTSESSG
jgi:nucleotide-binding universal stress UspA family protein